MAIPMKLNPLYSPYGAYELKAKYHRNLMLGSLITLGFVLFILGVFKLAALLSAEEEVFVAPRVIKTVAELGPPPTVAKRPPQVKVEKPNVAMPKVGIPKPVADEEVLDEDVVLASREELAEIVAPDVTVGEGGGDIVVDIADEDYLPDISEFVPVEILPEMIHEVKPEYPRLAREAGLEGRVWIKALVDKNGNVRDAVIAKSSGVEVLDQAALKVAKLNKFKPGIQNGRPVAVWVTYKVDFVLD